MRGAKANRNRLILLVIATGGIALVARADNPGPSFKDRTSLATQAYSLIEGRTGEITASKSEAGSKGQSNRVKCIEEKLKRAQQNQAAAKVVMEGWSLGESNPEYAQRSIDRLLLMQVYALVYAEEARACSDERPGPIGAVELKVDTGATGTNGGGANANGTPGTGNIDDDDNPTRRPKPERPPYASYY
jgi:hypothetical protein